MAIKVPIVSTYDNKGIIKADGALKKFGITSQAQFAKVATGFGLVGVAATKSFLALDSGFDAIVAGTGATGEALDGLKDSAKNVAREVPNSFADVGSAVAEVNTRLELTGPPLESMTKRFLDLARVTGGDVTEQIGKVTRVFGDWSIAAEDQELAMDKLVKITQDTGISLDLLAENVVQFGAPLRQLGFEFEEAAVIFGKFEKEGVNTTTVMSGLRMGLKFFAAAGEEPKEAFRALIAELTDLGSGIEATTRATEVFGVKAGGDMAAAITEGRFAIDDLVDGLDDTEGILDSTAEEMLSLQDRLKTLSNVLLVSAEPAVMTLAGALETVAEGFILAESALDEFQAGVAEFAGEDLSTLVLGSLDEQMERLGHHFTVMSTASGDIRAELEKLDPAYKATASSADLVAESIEKAIVAQSHQDKATAATKDAADAQENLEAATSATEQSFKDAEAASDDLIDSLEAQRLKVDDLYQAQLGLIDSDLAYRNSTEDSMAAVDAYTEVLGDSETTTREAEQASRDLEGVLLAQAGAALQVAQDQAEAEGATLSAREENVVYREELQRLVDIAGPGSPVAAALQSHIDRLNSVPESISTTLAIKFPGFDLAGQPGGPQVGPGGTGLGIGAAPAAPAFTDPRPTERSAGQSPPLVVNIVNPILTDNQLPDSLARGIEEQLSQIRGEQS